MKKLLLPIFACMLFAACNPIPDKIVFEELTTNELSSAIKSDSEFGDFYESIRMIVGTTTFSEVEKAQFNDVTYRRLYKYYKHDDDSTVWQSKKEMWGKEWDETMAKDLAKVNEKVAYWTDYKEKNSLSRFVKIELSDFYITHYDYIGGVDDAYICFNITPVQGTIEQLKFTYSYAYKIDGGKNKETHKCIYSSPISFKREGSWEIPYLEKDKFDGMTVSKFLQTYDLDIEVTDVRIDGKNYSLEDLNIPEAITDFWEEDNEETRDEVAVLVNPSYVNRKTYIENKKNESMKKYDSLCHDFIETIKANNIFLNLDLDF